MPNWCQNKLMVRAEGKDGELQIKAFKELADDSNGDLKTALSLYKLYPYPDKKWDWNWCVDNWGTKWDVQAKLVCDDVSYLSYEFDSAWSPPIEWLKYVSKEFPDLHFTLKYDEEGMGFMGVAQGQGGEISDNCMEY